MPAHIIGTIRVTDPITWQQYVDRVGATFPPYGGRVLFRGVTVDRLSGDGHGERVVVAPFPDLAALRAWFESPEYQALVALRDDGAEVVLTAYES